MRRNEYLCPVNPDKEIQRNSLQQAISWPTNSLFGHGQQIQAVVLPSFTDNFFSFQGEGRRV